MGQHNMPGAFKGNGYRKDQNLVSRFVVCHKYSKQYEGHRFRMADGKQYVVDKVGAFRKTV